MDLPSSNNAVPCGTDDGVGVETDGAVGQLFPALVDVVEIERSSEGQADQTDPERVGQGHEQDQERDSPTPTPPLSYRDRENEELEELCEMVMSFRCKQCSFLSENKATLLAHIKSGHVRTNSATMAPAPLEVTGRRRNRSNQNVNLLNPSYQGELGESSVMDIFKIKFNKKEIGKEEVSPVPSVPPTPDAFYVMSEDDGEDDHDPAEIVEIQRNDVTAGNCSDPPVTVAVNASGENGTMSDPMEMDDVFLCAECDIVFTSKEMCCSHMHVVHGLEHLDSDFIQEIMVSRRIAEEEEAEGDVSVQVAENVANVTTVTSATSQHTDLFTSRTRSRRTKVRPPRHLTLAEGAVVPKRYRVSKSILFKCTKCFLQYESEDVLNIHQKCHVEECGTRQGEESNDQRNGVVEEDSSHSAQLYASSDRSKRFKYACSVCGKVDNHALASSNTTACNNGEPKFFTKWSNCAAHLWREHQIDCELYSCSICKKFKNYYITKVKEHELLHRPETQFVCNICSKKFKQRHRLSSHQKYHREKSTRLPPPEESRWYTPKECPVCKLVLSDAKCLKRHISAVHNKIKAYCCNICGHRTARTAELQLHMRQHSGEKPYKCSKCPFVTGDHNSMRKHKLRHEDERPYACPYCNYACIQASAFKKHILSNHPDQDIVFKCHLCSHASVNEVVAAAHQRDHAEGRITHTATGTESSNDSADTSTELQHESENNDSDSSESSTDYPEIGIRSFGRTRPNTRKPKSPQKPRWLEQDDSVDVIDTGGVTIPASPNNDPPLATTVVQLTKEN